MNQITSTPHELSPVELLAQLAGLEDRAPLELIDAAAAHGDAMVAALADVVGSERPWKDLAAGEWWLLLHTAYILGRIPTEAAGLLLVRLMRALDTNGEEDVQDWLAGDWPMLFANKPRTVIEPACNMADDRSLDWYTRCQAHEVILDSGRREGVEALDTAIDRVAAIAADASDDWMSRSMAATALLDFPRQRHRALLEEIAAGEELRSKKPGHGPGAFTAKDIERALASNRDTPGWLRRGEPWRFYTPEAIATRQQRWAEESRDAPNSRYDDALLPDTYVRAAPKIGRNDPCRCGSGKKYKQCCLAKDEAVEREARANPF